MALKQTMSQSTINEFKSYIEQYPQKATWHIISDYCFDDDTKENDSMTFSVLLNHDNIDIIKKTIHDLAPKDIKNTRTINDLFLNYINSKVFYHFTFLLRKKDNFLSSIITKEFIEYYIYEIEEIINAWKVNSPHSKKYMDEVIDRLKLFRNDIKKKSYNYKLARKILLTSLISGLITYYLNLFSFPKAISWISDRDAMIDKYDGFIFDNSFINFLLYCSQNIIKLNDDIVNIEVPILTHVIPEKDGENYLDELIRIPDYLAGTLADFFIENNSFTNQKYNHILFNSLADSNNHSVIQIIDEIKGEKIFTRRVKHSW
jgi:hypothetical protein